VDNPDFDKITLTSDTAYSSEFNKDLLGGVQTITASEGENKTLYIPYYAWDNREAGPMKVWIDLK
jgi:DUF1680 family protein